MNDTETVTNEEATRWAQRLDWLHTEYGSDCSGVDSGDPLDCVEVEIRQALNKLQARITELEEERENFRAACDNVKFQSRLAILGNREFEDAIKNIYRSVQLLDVTPPPIKETK